MTVVLEAQMRMVVINRFIIKQIKIQGKDTKKIIAEQIIS
jgi:hypothetical protein